MKVGRLAIAGKVWVPQLLMAEKMVARMRGLLGRSGLPSGTAMLLRPCSSIHMVGMQFSLDELMEMSVVSGASKYMQKTSEAPSSISIITAEEIRGWSHGNI